MRSSANQSCATISMHEKPLMSCLYVRQLSYLSYNALAWHSMQLMRVDGEIAVKMRAPGGDRRRNTFSSQAD